MKALRYLAYGSLDEVEYTDLAKPTPKAGEVLVKIHAASVNAADWRMVKADPFLVRFMNGFAKPQNTLLGCDIAGTIEAVGANVTEFKPGDEVFGDIFNAGRGAFAEYAAVPEALLAPKPVNLSFEEAAALPLAGATALQGLRDVGKIQSGEKVLIVGASGGVGTFAVQIAKADGAEVTAVCSTSKVEMVRSLGADHIIDYKKEDVTKRDDRYDLILAANGYYPLAAYKRLLTDNGRYVAAGGKMGQLFEVMLFGKFRSSNGKVLTNVAAQTRKQDLLELKKLAEAGKLKPIIEQQYPLHQGVDAIRHVASGHALGKIIITMTENSAPASAPAG